MLRFASCLWAVVSFLSLGSAATLPTPQEFAGFRIGTDKKLVRWDKIVEYMQLAAASSPRIRTDEYGKTTNGNPYLVLTISSPDTIRSLDKYRATQRRLAYPRNLSGEEAESLIASHKVVLLITCNIHSTEIASSQMVLELIHRLATEDSPFVNRILGRVIFLLVPSQNPDGQIMVTDWYNKNVGTPFEYSPLPELYHKYTGHDNNRDAFMNTQLESKLLNKLTFKDWFPEVMLDEHQMGSGGARIFVPPFMDPINPNVDPMIWQLNGLLGYAMGAALHAKGYTGIVNDAQYTSWWQGGFVMQVWWHNMVGLLTEVASVAVATPIEQQIAKPGATQPPLSREQAQRQDPRRPLPPPRDTVARNTYPRPWLGGRWTLRDIVDYELTATYGLLEAVANNKDILLRNFYQMNRRQIELGENEEPFAWVVPAQQHDRAAATRMLQILDELGVEVHQAREPFEAGGKSYPAASHVILMAQPFRAFAKDMLEKQTYVAQRGANGAVERPYDVTGWTLPLQMGVDAAVVRKKFTAKLEPVSPVPGPKGSFDAGGQAVAWRISHNDNNASIAANRLLQKGVAVGLDSNGDFVARSRENLSGELRAMAGTLGITAQGLSALPSPIRYLKTTRLALYQPPQPSMDEGWTRWLLEQYEFPYSTIRKDDVIAGKLNDRFDAILLVDIAKDTLINGSSSEWMRPELRGGLGEEGVEALRRFVREGGTLITIGASSLLAVEEFPLPLRNALKGLRPDQFSCPGSILKVFIDKTNPVAYGMRDSASAYFYNNVAFDPAPAMGGVSVRTIARYPASNLLESGWIGGEEHLQDRIAAAEASFGKGRVVVLGFKVQNRAQPHGTFKLLFNSIHYAGMSN